MYCTDLCLARAQGHTVKAIPLYCRSWSCEVCAPRRAAQLRAEAHAGQPDTFITLTVNPAIGRDADHRARLLSRCWKEIRRRALIEVTRDVRRDPDPAGPKLDERRHTRVNGALPRMVRLHGSTIPFLNVFERTKHGEPHLHILARLRWLDQDWLSKQADEIMAAPIVDVKRVTSRAKVAAYVTKYIGKDPVKFRGCKRYWSSADYELPNPRRVLSDDAGGGPWKRVQGTLRAYIKESIGVGMWLLHADHSGAVLSWRPP